jgi:TrmH family RNA methyltransferase
MRLGPPITSRSNDRVKALRSAFSGEASRPGDLLGIEGENMIVEAIGSIAAFEAVYVREGSEAVLSRVALERVPVKNWVLLAREVFDAALPTRSPQGIAATFAIPDLTSGDLALSPGAGPAEGPLHGVSLVIEALQDPGNMGTLLRSAEAFGIRRILATQDTVNPWNPKAVRASAGSVFRIPVWRGDWHQLSAWLKRLGGLTYAAVAAADRGIPVTQVNLREPCALMIGNEGSGLTAQALEVGDAAVWIPCATESLNAAVAGSVLMYECMRQNAGAAGENRRRVAAEALAGEGLRG